MAKTGQQLYDNIHVTGGKDKLHAYVMLVKEESWLVLLHRTNYHDTPLGTTPRLWNNKVLMFTTSDIMENQVPQAVFFPRLLLAPTNQVISVDRTEQQLLKLHNFVDIGFYEQSSNLTALIIHQLHWLPQPSSWHEVGPP
jgi:hypothetical protein